MGSLFRISLNKLAKFCIGSLDIHWVYPDRIGNNYIPP